MAITTTTSGGTLTAGDITIPTTTTSGTMWVTTGTGTTIPMGTGTTIPSGDITKYFVIDDAPKNATVTISAKARLNKSSLGPENAQENLEHIKKKLAKDLLEQIIEGKFIKITSEVNPKTKALTVQAEIKMVHYDDDEKNAPHIDHEF